LNIADLPMPEPVKELLKGLGFVELFPPQEDAVKSGVLEGKNLVLASPTASGKTLIAELCALKHILEKGGKAVYLCPLRALASEKYEEFKKYTSLVKNDGRPVRIGITTGDFDSADPWLERMDVVIATNEKIDSLLRHKADWMSAVSLVVADEVHLLDSADRGPTLEVALARILQINPNAQVLALSATINNVDEIAGWLKAEYVTTEWRPVPLREGVLLQEEAQYKDGGSRKLEKITSDPAMNAALGTVKSGGQTLMFASTRRNSVTLAKRVSVGVERLLSKPLKLALEHDAEEVLATGERTRISDLLAELVERGVAFHHAGLSGGHRKIIENAFRQGRIKVLTATPTLAFGVNLPARTVVVQDYKRYEVGYGYYPISVLEYKQISGRAGRPKYDKTGESLLVARTEDEREYLMKHYVFASPERIWSRLAVESILRSHVLSTVAADYAHTVTGIHEFFGKTFYACQYPMGEIKKMIARILQFLYLEKMIEADGEDLLATRFGKRISELYIDPVSAVIIRDAVVRSDACLTDLSFLHLIAHTPDMGPGVRVFPKEQDDLCLFVEEHKSEFLVDMPDEWSHRLEYERFLCEVKTAKVLGAWIDEVSEDNILGKFSVQPGDLYRAIENAKWLLYATHELASLFGNKQVLPKTLNLMLRVDKGVKTELLPLIRLSGVGRARGRVLFNAGYKTVEDVKQAKAEELAKLPLIGLKLATRIIEQSRGRKEGPSEETVRKQKLLTDF